MTPLSVLVTDMATYVSPAEARRCRRRCHGSGKRHLDDQSCGRERRREAAMNLPRPLIVQGTGFDKGSSAFLGHRTWTPPVAKAPPISGQSASTKQSTPCTGISSRPAWSRAALTRSTRFPAPVTSVVLLRDPTVRVSVRGRNKPPSTRRLGPVGRRCGRRGPSRSRRRSRALQTTCPGRDTLCQLPDARSISSASGLVVYAEVATCRKTPSERRRRVHRLRHETQMKSGRSRQSRAKSSNIAMLGPTGPSAPTIAENSPVTNPRGHQHAVRDDQRGYELPTGT